MVMYGDPIQISHRRNPNIDLASQRSQDSNNTFFSNVKHVFITFYVCLCDISQSRQAQPDPHGGTPLQL